MQKQISSNRTLLPTTEACKITGFSSAYIQRLLRDKRIEGVKIGAVWLVYEDSLNAFIAEPRRRGPKGPHRKTENNHIESLPDSKHTEKTDSNGKSQRTK